MLRIIMALVKEFEKPIGALSFDDKEPEIHISFADGTSVVALVPDLLSTKDDFNYCESMLLRKFLAFFEYSLRLFTKMFHRYGWGTVLCYAVSTQVLLRCKCR